jgi:hypothetical protein
LSNLLHSSSSNIICIKCRKPAFAEEPVERLPDGGTLVKAIHADGKECKWAEYDTIEDVMEDRNRIKNPRMIVCPACSKEGRVTHYYPNRMKKENVVYYVAHEEIEGYWGKSQKSKRRRRCYIRDPKQRDILLKELGRYIEPQLQKQEAERNEPHSGAQVRRDIRGQTQHKESVIIPRRNTKHKTNSVLPQNGKSSQHTVPKKLDRYVKQSSHALSKRDENGKNYKKMYYDLVDTLRRIVNDADRATSSR